jgi:hypothetical protein
MLRKPFEECKNYYSKSKVKLSHYRHAGAKAKRRYSAYSFFTSALDGVSG